MTTAPLRAALAVALGAGPRRFVRALRPAAAAARRGCRLHPGPARGAPAPRRLARPAHGCRVHVRAPVLDALGRVRRLGPAGHPRDGVLRPPGRCRGRRLPAEGLAGVDRGPLGERRGLALVVPLRRHALGPAGLRHRRHAVRLGAALRGRHRREPPGRTGRHDARLGGAAGPGRSPRRRRERARARRSGAAAGAGAVHRDAGRRDHGRGGAGRRAGAGHRHPLRPPPGDPQPRRHDHPAGCRRGGGGGAGARPGAVARERHGARPVPRRLAQPADPRGGGGRQRAHPRRGDRRRPPTGQDPQPGDRLEPRHGRRRPLHQAAPGAVWRVHPVARQQPAHQPLRRARARGPRHAGRHPGGPADDLRGAGRGRDLLRRRLRRGHLRAARGPAPGCSSSRPPTRRSAAPASSTSSSTSPACAPSRPAGTSPSRRPTGSPAIIAARRHPDVGPGPLDPGVRRRAGAADLRRTPGDPARARPRPGLPRRRHLRPRR